MKTEQFIQEPIQARWIKFPTMVGRTVREQSVLHATSPEGIRIEWYAGLTDGEGYTKSNVNDVAFDVWYITNINRTDLDEGPRFITYDFAKQVALALVKRYFKAMPKHVTQ